MNGRVSDPRPPSALREHDLLARLGLGPGASNDEVEAAHDEILDFLGRAPGSLRGWASVQVTEADEAYAHLNGAPPSATAMEPLMPPAAEAVRAKPVIRGGLDADLDGFEDDADGPVVITRRGRGAAQAGNARAAAVRSRPMSAATAAPGALVIAGGTLRKAGIAGVAVALVAALVIGVYGLGPSALPGLTGTPAPDPSSGLDTAQVASLMQKITANPKDTVSLMALATLYYNTGDFTTAETWLQKVLDIDPKNVDALLTIGAAQFNGGDDTSAQLAWEKVLTIDSKNIEAYYDLGFMYFSQTPPNVDKVREEWGEVIKLAPDSDVAQTVAAHLASLGSPAPSSSGTPGGSPPAGSPAPGGSAAPASSGGPAPSPAPSAGPGAS